MNIKLILPALFATVAILPQVERYQAVEMTKTRPHTNTLEYYRPSRIVITGDGYKWVIDTSIYEVYNKHRAKDSILWFDCTDSRNVLCYVTLIPNKQPRYDASLMIAWKDSQRIYHVNKY